MDIVQVTRRIVDQQVRPAQRGSTTAGGARAQGGTRMLRRADANGVAVAYGTYGRGRYGRRRYVTAS